MEQNFFITGIQQIGVGTTNVYKSWKWYKEMFGTDIRILEDDTVAERMLPYTGGQKQKRHAAIAINLQGGGGFEIWQYSDRKPKPIDFDLQVGDLGIFAAKLKATDVQKAYQSISSKWNNVGPIVKDPLGKDTFFLSDIEGNYFQVVQSDNVLIDRGTPFGGMVGGMIGVTDMEKSIKLYKDVLGYGSLVYDKTGVFDDLRFMRGGDQKYRRVLLEWNQPKRGAFSPLMEGGRIELLQALERTPRKLFEGRFWGDPGFIQICFDVTNMDLLGKYCAENGYAFTVDSCPDGKVFNMGDASGRFTYIEDPDGTLIEFVETYRVAVAKRFNWYIDLLKRNREKPLPKILFRAMKFNKVKFED